MAIRPTMQNLVSQVAQLCGLNLQNQSALPVTPDFIQTALDRTRREMRWVPLRPVQTFQVGGGVLFFDYYSDTQWWEDDVLLQDMAYNNVTANVDLAEPIVGHWHFPTQPNGIGIRATGKTYDPYAAAADVLEAWAAQLALDFDFGDTTAQYKRSQKAESLRKQAALYRQQAMPRVSRLVQGDAAPEHDGAGVTFPSMRGDGYGYGP